MDHVAIFEGVIWTFSCFICIVLDRFGVLVAKFLV